MSGLRRATICVCVLSLGLAGQLTLEALTVAERPPLKRPLTTLPLTIGDWLGKDVPMNPDVLEQAQATEHVNRIYRHRKNPDQAVSLWINYSKIGDNLRHSPEICLPSNGWSKVESLCKAIEVPIEGSSSHKMSILGYSRVDATQTLGFWYYIFGEGWWEKRVRELPISSRSSFGRATRGSSLTVEIFCDRSFDPDGHTIEDFARALIAELEPLLPDDQARYHVP